jgi:hypothetical protein
VRNWKGNVTSSSKQAWLILSIYLCFRRRRTTKRRGGEGNWVESNERYL